MIDIGIYLIGNKDFAKNKILFSSNNYYSINLFKESTNYNFSVQKVAIDNIPTYCEHDFIMLLDSNTYLLEGFFDKCISLHQIMSNVGIICGPTVTENNTLHKCYEYNINLQSTVISDITDEDNNYPQINGCLISKDAYNYFCYTPTKSDRHQSIDNKSFIYSVSKKYQIVYCSQLKKLYIPDVDSIDSYYYNIGYQDGSLLRYKAKEEQHKNIWHRFVESPESIDREMPRWFFRKDLHNDAEMLERTILIKCKYQIGFLEGMMNKSLL